MENKSNCEKNNEYLDENSKKIFDELGKMMDVHCTGVFVADPKKFLAIDVVYEAMRLTVTGDNLEIKKKINDPFPRFGDVVIIGNNLKFKRPDLVALSIEISSNFEIGARTDNRSEVSFSFDNITKRVK